MLLLNNYKKKVHLNILSAFADDATYLPPIIDINRSLQFTLDQKNSIATISTELPSVQQQNIQLNPLPPPLNIEEEILLNVNVSTVSLSAETELIRYEMGESYGGRY